MTQRKRIMVQMTICVLLVCVIWGGFFFVSEKFRRIIEIEENDFSWVYQVESVEKVKKKFLISGFAFQLGCDSREEAFEIILKDVESGGLCFAEMEYLVRDDVGAFFFNGYDFARSGFVAIINQEELDLEQKTYEILLRVMEERTAFQTGVYITEGEVVYANPDFLAPLEVEGTDLEKVVKQGVLRAYFSEDRVYVYQYNGEFYWIAEKESKFIDDYDYIQYEYDVWDVEDSQQGEDIRWFREKKELRFGESEAADDNFGKYCVVKNSYLKNCFIEIVRTGIFRNEDYNIYCFRPYYEIR